jgi:hypothetical protein
VLDDRARIEALLEGVDLPAGKTALIAYAREHDPKAAEVLERLPEREYTSLDEVGEALVPVQSQRTREHVLPRPESGLAPGGDDYINPKPKPGAVRPDGPPSARVAE